MAGRLVLLVLRNLMVLTVLGAEVLSPMAADEPRIASAQAAPHSLLLNGVTGVVEAPASPDLNLLGDWSIEWWLKDTDPQGFDRDYRYLINKGDGARDAPYYLLLGNGSLLVGLRALGVNHPLTYNLQAASFSAKIWQHVAATFDAATTTLTLYLNGVQVAQQVLGARPVGNTLPLEIGRQGAVAGRFWSGGVDDVRLWSIVRAGATFRRST